MEQEEYAQMHELQAAQQARNVPFSTPMEKYGNNMIILTNPEGELYKMELSFRGMKMNNDGELVVNGEPLMNEKGIASIIGTTQSVVNQVTILGNLTNDDISKHMNHLSDTLIKDLMVNRVKYGIYSFAVRDRILFMALTQARIAMSRAEVEGYSDKKLWGKIFVETNARVESPKKESGFLSKIWRR